MTLVESGFVALANFERKSLGMPELPLAVVPHAMGGYESDEAIRRANDAATAMADDITIALTIPTEPPTQERQAARSATFEPTVLPEDASFEGINRYFYDMKWADGLPIVPPTRSRLAAMLRYSDRGPDHVLGKMGPSWNATTVHHVAVNAVMAGCLPEYFPVLLAGVEAILDPEFNLYGVQGTTNPAGVMLLVNGPIARELDINGGPNVFGQGWFANGTIGRALRLVMINIGGGIPGEGDMSTLGSPNKWGSCIAENEALSPWPPYQVDRGFDATTSTVTAVATTAPQNVTELSADPIAILDTLARSFCSSGSNCVYFDHEPMVVIGPVQAAHLARGGFDKAAVRRYLWEHGTMTFEGLSETTQKTIRKWKAKSIRVENGVEVIHPTPSADNIGIVVAGGDSGPHCAVLATFNGTHLITRAIARADGTPLRSVHDARTRW